jgi:hypothetical protein
MASVSPYSNDISQVHLPDLLAVLERVHYTLHLQTLFSVMVIKTRASYARQIIYLWATPQFKHSSLACVTAYSPGSTSCAFFFFPSSYCTFCTSTQYGRFSWGPKLGSSIFFLCDPTHSVLNTSAWVMESVKCEIIALFCSKPSRAFPFSSERKPKSLNL